MIFEGDQSVLEALKEKKRLIDSGSPHDHIKPLLIIDGGLMKGVYGAGAALALQELGYDYVFDNFGGVSSGAATIAYLLSGNGEVGKRVMYEDCCSRQFVNFWRFWNILNPNVFEAALRGQTGKPLNTENILKRQHVFFIGLADYKTGSPVLFYPETEEELLYALRASITMPGTTRLKTFVRGVRYSDGASTYPLAVEKMIATIDATHILFITNQDKHTKKIPAVENFINNTLFRHRMPRPLRVAASIRWETRHAMVHRILQHKPKPILFAWGDDSIKSFEQNPETVKSVIERSRLWWSAQLI